MAKHGVGVRGTAKHQYLVGFLTPAAYSVMRDIGTRRGFIFVIDEDDTDAMKSKALGTQGVSVRDGVSSRNRKGRDGSRKGGYYPDVVWQWIERRTGNVLFNIAVEVGKFNPDRCPRKIPTIHVGFNGDVSMINPDGPTGYKIMSAICASLQRHVKEAVRQWDHPSEEQISLL